MADEELLRKLSSLGVDIEAPRRVWNDAAELLAAFDAIGRVCSTALVKVDGERSKNVYTVLLSGGRLGKRVFRKDGDDLPGMLREAIVFFVAPE